MIPVLVQAARGRRRTASGLPKPAPSGRGVGLACLGALTALSILSHVLAGPLVLLLLFVGGVLMASPPVREHFRRRRGEAEDRQRSFQLSERLSVVMGRPVWVGRIDPTSVGERVMVQVSVGLSGADLDRRTSAIAAALAARSVRVRVHPDNASWVEINVVRSDPFAGGQPLAWPPARVGRMSLWEPVPVGVDDTGQVVTITLPSRNILLGGEPGAGKSVALSLLVAAAALDPTCKLWLLDGKTVDLAVWEDSAVASAGADVNQAVAILRTVQAEMEERYRQLKRLHKSAVDRAMGLPLHVLVCDELAMYLTLGERKARTDFAEVLRDLVARGRAAGVIVLAATQKPSSDVVPTSVRDLFGFRWALRCATRDASDTVLGTGWASMGYSADDIDAARRGLGYLRAEGTVPTKLQAFFLDEASITSIAAEGRGPPESLSMDTAYPRWLEEVIRRASDPEGFTAWNTAGRAARWCRHPVRLVGRTTRLDPETGEVTRTFDSENLPDAVLLKPCGQRRRTACPECAEIYRGDAWQLIVSGLRGGKGVDESVATRPAVFVTLTAPSFGVVHSAQDPERWATPCRRGDVNAHCSHGSSVACYLRHEKDDALVGSPICPDCYDYVGAVLWNAAATELWRRTILTVEMQLAQQMRWSRRELRSRVRLSYAKIVEYQRRGVVHVHAVLRADSHVDRYGIGDITAADLVVALTNAATQAEAPLPASLTESHARWGVQVDVRPLTEDGLRAGVAGYIAKYATKSTDDLGLLDRRVRGIAALSAELPEHLARMVRTAWDLAEHPDVEHLRLRAWAHTLGFRGHWLTKSRAYSTTFTELRSARSRWAARADDDPDGLIDVAEWQFAGRGWTTAGDAQLAATAATTAAESRRLARRARAEEASRRE